MPSIVDDILNLLDQRVEQCLSVENPEKELITTYFELWSSLKERVGTSAGFTGLSEYLFFRYVLRRIEQKTQTHFKAEKYTNETYIFRSVDFLLTHDFNIAQLVKNIRRQKTDIAVLAHSSHANYQLLAAFELKIYISDLTTLQDMFDRFRNLSEHTNALLVPILFVPQYSKEISHFLAEYPQRAFLISKNESPPAIGLNQIIDKAIGLLPTAEMLPTSD